MNSFFYLHEIMIKIKENKDIKSIFLIINCLNDHINKCNKIGCNCNLLLNLIKKDNLDSKKKEIINKYIIDLLNILNYLFESSFI